MLALLLLLRAAALPLSASAPRSVRRCERRGLVRLAARLALALPPHLVPPSRPPAWSKVRSFHPCALLDPADSTPRPAAALVSLLAASSPPPPPPSSPTLLTPAPQLTGPAAQAEVDNFLTEYTPSDGVRSPRFFSCERDDQVDEPAGVDVFSGDFDDFKTDAMRFESAMNRQCKIIAVRPLSLREAPLPLAVSQLTLDSLHRRTMLPSAEARRAARGRRSSVRPRSLALRPHLGLRLTSSSSPSSSLPARSPRDGARQVQALPRHPCAQARPRRRRVDGLPRRGRHRLGVAPRRRGARGLGRPPCRRRRSLRARHVQQAERKDVRAPLPALSRPAISARVQVADENLVRAGPGSSRSTSRTRSTSRRSRRSTGCSWNGAGMRRVRSRCADLSLPARRSPKNSSLTRLSRSPTRADRRHGASSFSLAHIVHLS